MKQYTITLSWTTTVEYPGHAMMEGIAAADHLLETYNDDSSLDTLLVGTKPITRRLSPQTRKA